MWNHSPETYMVLRLHAPLPNLNGGYTIFGKVTKGLGVALALMPRDPSQNPSAPPGDMIKTITITEN